MPFRKTLCVLKKWEVGPCPFTQPCWLSVSARGHQQTGVIHSSLGHPERWPGQQLRSLILVYIVLFLFQSYVLPVSVILVKGFHFCEPQFFLHKIKELDDVCLYSGYGNPILVSFPV